MYLRQLKILGTVEEHLKIKQKQIKHAPLDKLLDAFMNILAGGQGIVEVNTRFVLTLPCSAPWSPGLRRPIDD